MLDEQIGVIVQTLLMGLGTIRAYEVFRAGYQRLYKRSTHDRARKDVLLRGLSGRQTSEDKVHSMR